VLRRLPFVRPAAAASEPTIPSLVSKTRISTAHGADLRLSDAVDAAVLVVPTET
jgi:hypothetical protein